MSDPQKYENLDEYRDSRAARLARRPGDVFALYQQYQRDPEGFLNLVRDHRTAREEIIQERIDPG